MLGDVPRGLGESRSRRAIRGHLPWTAKMWSSLVDAFPLRPGWLARMLSVWSVLFFRNNECPKDAAPPRIASAARAHGPCAVAPRFEGIGLHAEFGDTVFLRTDILRHREANRARARDKQHAPWLLLSLWKRCLQSVRFEGHLRALMAMACVKAHPNSPWIALAIWAGHAHGTVAMPMTRGQGQHVASSEHGWGVNVVVSGRETFPGVSGHHERASPRLRLRCAAQSSVSQAFPEDLVLRICGTRDVAAATP